MNIWFDLNRFTLKGLQPAVVVLHILICLYQCVICACVVVVTDYYSPTMLGLKTDQEVLGELVKVKVPQVWQMMVDHNVMWTLVVSRWFICLYIDILPVEVSVSVITVFTMSSSTASKLYFVAVILLYYLKNSQIIH